MLSMRFVGADPQQAKVALIVMAVMFTLAGYGLHVLKERVADWRWERREARAETERSEAAAHAQGAPRAPDELVSTGPLRRAEAREEALTEITPAVLRPEDPLGAAPPGPNVAACNCGSPLLPHLAAIHRSGDDTEIIDAILVTGDTPPGGLPVMPPPPPPERLPVRHQPLFPAQLDALIALRSEVALLRAAEVLGPPQHASEADWDAIAEWCRENELVSVG
jgi:hypothetical protein